MGQWLLNFLQAITRHIESIVFPFTLFHYWVKISFSVLGVWVKLILVHLLCKAGNESKCFLRCGPFRVFLWKEFLHKTGEAKREAIRHHLLLSMHNVVPKYDQIVSLEWRLECAQMIERTSYRPNVHLEIVRLMLDELRRQVKRRSNSSPLESSHGWNNLRNSKIPDLQTWILLCNEDVKCLDVSVNNASWVQVLNTQENLIGVHP